MPRSRKKEKSPKRVLALNDLEQAKSAVLNTLTSKSGQRTYDHAITEFVEWYCSEPRSDQQEGCHIRTVPIPLWVKRAADSWTGSAQITTGRVPINSFKNVTLAGVVKSFKK